MHHEGAERRAEATPRAVPTATYRLQLNERFGFADVARLAPYFATLGISHVYLSPILQASTGSEHGYDVVDHRHLSEELGGIDGYRAMSTALRAEGIGQVLDIVPNHMALEVSQNRWWWDVLQNGPSSRYAAAFDVSWTSADDPERDRVLVAVLDDHYGRVLAAGRLRLERDGLDLVVRVEEQTFPIDPRSMDTIIEAVGARLGDPAFSMVADALTEMPYQRNAGMFDHGTRERQALAARRVLAALLADPAADAAFDEIVAQVDADAEQLDALLERQHYRLAHWRVAQQELDYRRFFDVSTLIGLRMEAPGVFQQTHNRLLELVHDGDVQGLRVDHVDGLRSPAGYLATLAAHAPDCWIVVEKILEGDEELRHWPIAGTTGYEALQDIQRVLAEPSGVQPLTELYRELTGDQRTFEEVAIDGKRQVLRDMLAPELERLVTAARTATSSDRRWRDVTRADLRRAIELTLAAFPVYRTYFVDGGGVHDEAVVSLAVRHARDAAALESDHLDPLAFDALVTLLVGEGVADAGRESFVARFEQLAGPVMAKGVEDTAFYRYQRFVAANEVGGDPSRITMTTDDFHRVNEVAWKDWPHRMVTTSTHDAKRSEDVRARLLTIAEHPDAWARTARDLFARDERRVEPLPDAPMRYLLHQTLVGAHPLDAERMTAFALKAAREAKEHTSWLAPDEVYEERLVAYVSSLLGDAEVGEIVERFVAEIEPLARANSLSQTLLRCTIPGVPDLYQGNEQYTYALVDPDNRTPVDHAAIVAAAPSAPTDVLDPQAKRWVTQQALRVRTQLPEAFGAAGCYSRLAASGACAANIVAFARGGRVVTVATRSSGAVRDGWGDTSLALPPGRWHDVLHGADHQGTVLASDLLATVPVALLVLDDAEDVA